MGTLIDHIVISVIASFVRIAGVSRNRIQGEKKKDYFPSHHHLAFHLYPGSGKGRLRHFRIGLFYIKMPINQKDSLPLWQGGNSAWTVERNTNVHTY